MSILFIEKKSVLGHNFKGLESKEQAVICMNAFGTQFGIIITMQ